MKPSQPHPIRAILATLAALLAVLPACKVGSGGTRANETLPSGSLSREEAYAVVEEVFTAHRIKLRPNQKVRLLQNSVAFNADGYDPNIHAGYVYNIPYIRRSPEDPEPDLTEQERQQLDSVAGTYGEYFLILEPGAEAAVRSRAEEFVDFLYKKGVIVRQVRRDTGEDFVPGVDAAAPPKQEPKLGFEAEDGRKVKVVRDSSGADTEDTVLENIKKDEQTKLKQEAQEEDAPGTKHKGKKQKFKKGK